jgi:MFS family permease
LSAVGGWVSLLFLKIIPDVEQGESHKNSNTRIPWREIVSFPPFFKLTLHALLIGISASTGGVFCIAFMKSPIVHYGESQILYIVTLYFIGPMLVLPFVGHVVERVGSKAAMFFSVGIMCASFLTWFLMAGKIAAPSLVWIGLLYFTGGIAGGTFAVGQTRLMMNTMPEMGRSHFFAFFYVITSLGVGIAPIFWGMMIDALERFSAVAGPAQWNKYSIYFFTQFVILAITTLYTSALHEKTGPVSETEACA